MNPKPWTELEEISASLPQDEHQKFLKLSQQGLLDHKKVAGMIQELKSSIANMRLSVK